MGLTKEERRKRKKRKYHKEWVEANRERVRATNRAYKKANPHRAREWYNSNKERARRTRRAWAAKNKEHLRATRRAWKEANRERADLINHRSSLKKRYGMNYEQYKTLLRTQKGRCACCGRKERMKNKNGKVYRLAVDHCHKTKKIRALLCCACNKTIGLLNAKQLRQAADYLDRVG